jgi:branched-chain amino acid transport system ATP-binding protein
MTQLVGAAEGGAFTARDASPALLAVDGVTIRFGGVLALDDVSFDVARGQICGLIGPNGAGKTSLFNCISRLYDPHSGSIRFDGRPLDRVPRHEIAALGIARTFQNLALFGTMTVRQNVMVGMHAIARGGFLANALSAPIARREEKRIAERASALVEEFGLSGVADRPVDELPFGAKKRVELARALAGEPKLLLLDEPAAGVAPAMEEVLIDTIHGFAADGVDFLIIEHDLDVVAALCEHVYVMAAGRILTQGSFAQVTADSRVVEAYLGLKA